MADDTPDDIYQSVNTTLFPNVRQYKMPAESGWFAGRGLAISQVNIGSNLTFDLWLKPQVETDYFIWMDDDFVATNETDLELLFSIIEATNYDVIAGKVGFSEKVSRFQSELEIHLDEFCRGRMDPENRPYDRMFFFLFCRMDGFDPDGLNF